ncbi:MAG: hypothetical protein ABSH32_10945 [Bryobacteraceae bacterium]|jgi:hypothetical protein
MKNTDPQLGDNRRSCLRAGFAIAADAAAGGGHKLFAAKTPAGKVRVGYTAILKSAAQLIVADVWQQVWMDLAGADVQPLVAPLTGPDNGPTFASFNATGYPLRANELHFSRPARIRNPSLCGNSSYRLWADRCDGAADALNAAIPLNTAG